MDELDSVSCVVIWTLILPRLRSEWSSRLPMMGDGLHIQPDETLCE
jgi:hypothetical protein